MTRAITLDQATFMSRTSFMLCSHMSQLVIVESYYHCQGRALPLMMPISLTVNSIIDGAHLNILHSNALLKMS